MSNTIDVWYDAVLNQMAAEAYLEGVDLSEPGDIKEALVQGNNRPGFEPRGLTKFSDSQATEFLTRFQIIHQWSDNPLNPVGPTDPGYLALNGQQILANSGLSATLIKNVDPDSPQFGSYTLSVRSTEYQSAENGGDKARDLWGADAGGIFLNGFALAQWNALEQYYEWLKATGTLPAGSGLHLTGYSLSSNLATLFTETHPEVVHTYNFNGPGRGNWNQSRGDLQAMLDYYRTVLADPQAAAPPSSSVGATVLADYADARTATGDLNLRNIYDDPRHRWAAYATYRDFGASFNPISDASRTGLTNGADARITQLYGQAENGDTQYVANSGIHGPTTRIFIEDQPDVQNFGLFDAFGKTGDFGTTHSITLIADSLALMHLFAQLDSEVSVQTLRSIFAAASSERATGLVGTEGTAEGDSLERVLQSLAGIFGVELQEMGPNRGVGGFASTEQRNIFYQNLKAVADAVSAADPSTQYSIQVLAEISPSGLAGLAGLNDDTGKAYRYALRELNPFVLEVSGPQPEAYEEAANSRLDPTTGEGLSDEWIASRAKLLDASLRQGVRDEDLSPAEIGGYFEDRALNLTFGSPLGAYSRHLFGGSEGDKPLIGLSQDDFLFGGSAGEVISGGFGKDHLEGGGGLDRLSGGADDDTLLDLDRGKGDRLDGGTGFDTYTAEFGDVIIDAPEANAGAVYVYVGADKVRLTGGTRTGDSGYYASSDGRFRYWSDGQGGVQVFRASGGMGLTIEAPSAAVPGYVDTDTQSVRGRPDLGIALIELKDPRPKGPGSGTAGVKSLFDLAKTYRPFGDPLALDLNADGFQTVGDLGEGTVLFDHDAVGVRNGTGWLTGVDALVALDRDGDGAITTGRELFGDNTLLLDGSLGADGFTALAPMDTNGDLVVDASDAPLEAWQVPGDADGDGEIAPGETRGATFDDLLLWRDDNLNGISEPFELRRLPDSGIVSIGLAKTLVNQSLPGGNTLRYRGTFTLDDGTTGAAGALNLTRETFYREYASAPAYEPGVEGLPAISGTGRVRDLQEAAADSPALRQLVEAAAAATDRTAQAALTAQIIEQWAVDSAMLSGTAESAARPNAPVLVYSIPGIAAGSIGSAYAAASGGLPVNPADLPANWYETQQSQQYRDAASMISTLERFTGQTFADVRNSGSALVHAQTFEPQQPGDPAQTVNVYATTVSIGAGNFQFLQDAYALLQEAVVGSVAVQTRLLPYVDAALAGASSGDFSQVEALISDKRVNDRAGALADVVELGKYVGEDLIAKGWTNLPLMIGEWVHDARADATLASTLSDLQVGFRNDWGLRGGPTSDVLVGTHWDPPFASGAVLTTSGGYGDDLLFGDSDFEILFGGHGNDILYGGPDGEVLAPGLGRDIILFGRGSGVDQVDSSRDPDILASMATFGLPILPATDRDAVYMLPGVAPADVRVRFSGPAYYAYTGPFSGGWLEGISLSIRGTEDVLIDSGFSLGGTTSNNARSIEEVHFADGTVWDLATLRLKQMEGTELDDRSGAEGLLRGFEDADNTIDGKGGNDRLEGRTRNDTLIGGTGNDELLGNYGDDLLIGGDGNDILEGYFGTDVLNGGAGNDQLYGGPGTDYYMLARGGGVDRLSNGNAFTFSGIDPTLDVVQAESGIAPQEVLLQRRSNGLHILVAGDGAELWDSGAAGPTDPNPDYLGESVAIPSIGRIEFADGTIWGGQEIKARSLLGATDGNDEFYGFETSGDAIAGKGGNDLIRGVGGDDVLSGDGGDDTLEGGAGNDLLSGGEGGDTLRGGAGADTYEFGRGDGQDDLHDSDEGNGTVNTLRLRDVNPGELIREDNVLTITGTDDRIALWGVGAVGEVVYGDGTRSALDAVPGPIVAPPPPSPPPPDPGGEAGPGSGSSPPQPPLPPPPGGPTDGNDFIVGTPAADTLAGGRGDDVILGGAGSDMYVFNLGDGFDVFAEDPALGEPNFVRFGPGIAASDLHPEAADGALIIQVGGGGDAIAMLMGTIAELRFDSGETLTMAQLLAPPEDLGAQPEAAPGNVAVPPSSESTAETAPPAETVQGSDAEPVAALVELTSATEAPAAARSASSTSFRASQVVAGESGAAFAPPALPPRVGVPIDPLFRDMQQRFDVLLQTGRTNLGERYPEAIREFERRRVQREEAPAPPPPTEEEVEAWNSAMHAWHERNPGFGEIDQGGGDGVWTVGWGVSAGGNVLLDGGTATGAIPALANPHALPRLTGTGAAPGLAEGMRDLR